jgi:hypothetical protein
VSSGRFTAKQIKQVNYCRLYLQVVTAADVVLPSGYLIDEWILARVIHVNSSRTRFVKVVQGKPDKTTWLQWRRLMQLVGEELIQRPLGEWLHPAPCLRRLWPCYVDLRSKFLYGQGASYWLCPICEDLIWRLCSWTCARVMDSH